MEKKKNKLKSVTQQTVRFRLPLIVTGIISLFGIIFFLFTNLSTPTKSKGNTKKIISDQFIDRITVIRSFSISALEEKASLHWETSSEKNNDYFFIERSWDAKEFEVLGRVKGYGTTLVSHQYKFIDDIPFLGTSLYRLTQYNTDGEAQMFITREFKYELSNTEMKILQIGPIPFTEEVSLLMQFPKNTQLRVQLLTLEGKKIWETMHGVLAGRESFSLRPEVSASGVYHLRMSNSEGKAVMTKLVKR